MVSRKGAKTPRTHCHVRQPSVYEASAQMSLGAAGEGACATVGSRQFPGEPAKCGDGFLSGGAQDFGGTLWAAGLGG